MNPECFTKAICATKIAATTVAQMAALYAECLRASEGEGFQMIDYPALNRAIAQRWPKYALAIRKMAWQKRKKGTP